MDRHYPIPLRLGERVRHTYANKWSTVVLRPAEGFDNILEDTVFLEDEDGKVNSYAPGYMFQCFPGRPGTGGTISTDARDPTLKGTLTMAAVCART